MSDVTGAGPPATVAVLALAMLGRRARADIDTELGEIGMSIRYLSALGHLGRRPGTSGSELARRAGVTSQSMQATLQRLEELGAIIRRDERTQGQRADYAVSAKGRRLIARAEAIIERADQRLREQLGDAGHRELAPLLGELLITRA